MFFTDNMESSQINIERLRLKRIIDRLIPVNPPEGHPHGANIQWEKSQAKYLIDVVQYLGENYCLIFLSYEQNMKPIFYILDEGKFHELLKTSANTKRGAVQILIKLYWTWCHNVFVTHTLSEGFYASVGQCKTKWKRY